MKPKHYKVEIDPMNYPTSDSLGDPRARLWFYQHELGGDPKITEYLLMYERMALYVSEDEIDKEIFKVIYKALKEFHSKKIKKKIK